MGLPMEISKDELWRDRMAGMAKKALKGSAAIMLFASSLSEATRAVVYTEPIVIAQLPRNKQIANAFEITDRLISALNTRDSTPIGTDPSPDLLTKGLVPAASWE